MTEGSAAPRLRRLSAAVVAAIAVVAVPAAAAPTGDTAAPLRAVLIDEGSKASIVSLTGKRLPVPARVHESPRGLSPDARLIAKSGTDAVFLGPVRGGTMRAVLRGSCAMQCPYGSDPRFAWSPDSRRLAATANPAHRATLLALFDSGGRKLRSLTLPRTNAEQGGRAFHRVHSWSPNGSRLLLVRENEFGPTALVAVDLDTGKLRTLTAISGPGAAPEASWSPDGRFVAFTSSGTHDALDVFSVIDAATARPIIRCPKDFRKPPPECPGGTVWAADSRSVFGPGVNRYFLDGRPADEVEPARGSPYVATQSGLIHAKGGKVYFHRFATRRSNLLFASSSSAGISSVLPLARLP